MCIAMEADISRLRIFMVLIHCLWHTSHKIEMSIPTLPWHAMTCSDMTSQAVWPCLHHHLEGAPRICNLSTLMPSPHGLHLHCREVLCVLHLATWPAPAIQGVDAIRGYAGHRILPYNAGAIQDHDGTTCHHVIHLSSTCKVGLY